MQILIRNLFYNNREYLWALIGKFLPQVVFLVTTMILSRLLTPNDFGMVGVLSIFIYLAGILMDSGLGGSLVKEKVVEPIDCSTIFTFNLFVSSFLYLIMFISAPYIEAYFNINGLCEVTRVLSLIFVISAIGLVPNSMMVKRLMFKEISFALIISTVLSSVVAIIIAIYTRSVYSIVIYQLLQAAIMVCFYHYYCHISFSLRFSFASLKKLLPFGFSSTLSSVFDSVYENIISIVLGKFAGATAVGYFSQAKRVEEVPSKSIAQTISNTAFPILVKYVGNEERMDYESLKIFHFTSLLLIPIFGIFICYPELIVTLLFGDDWIEVSSYLKLLSFAGIFLFIDTMYRGFIKSANKPGALLKSTMIKRGVGILIILFTALKSPGNILIAYILSSAFAGGLSISYYANIIGTHFWTYTLRMLPTIFLSFIPLCLMIIIDIVCDLFIIKILLSFVILVVYYLMVLVQKIKNNRL